MLEGPSFEAAPLLDAFGHFVAGVAARQRLRCPQTKRSADSSHSTAKDGTTGL